MEKATFGGGCFWGVEEIFRKVKGVTKTTVGYAGGKTENPTYEQVCANTTGHKEVVQLEFDPKKVSYEELLDVFWSCHDPTSLDKQGPDVGTQYRSVIFYHTEKQKERAYASKEKWEKTKGYKIVTEILPLKKFYPAEEYHQHYLQKRDLGFCHT